MPSPRQLIDLPVATQADAPDVMLLRQGLFDKQVAVSVLLDDVLLGSNNLSDVADAATARTNLGIDVSDFLAATNNLSDLDNTTTARTNLGVSSSAETLLVANNLSDLASAATARTNLGVTASTITAVNNATNTFAYNIQDEMQIRSYSESATALGNMNTAQAFDFSVGNIFSATTNDDVTITFTNPAAAGQASSIFIILTDGGDHAITWPASVDWPGATAPTLTSGGVDLLVFTTIDSGTTWYGAVAGLAFG